MSDTAVMPYDLSYRAVQPARNPGQQVTVDLRRMYGPRRLWGQSTPLIVRSKGWEPTTATPAVVEGTVQSAWADYWVYVRIPLLNSLGEVLKRDVGLLVPPEIITARTSDNPTGPGRPQ
jgi:hypothetical protein